MPKSIPAFLFCLLITTAARAADAPPPCEFLSDDAARSAIVDDSLDPYFARMCPHEMALKTGSPVTGVTQADRVAECKKLYQAAAMDFTDDEKADLQWAVDAVQAGLVRDYPVFGKTPFSFIKISDSLEGGMPHTRGSHVVVPEGMLRDLHRIHESADDRGRRFMANVLVHEQTHVLERLHPDLFVPLFTDVFHFVRAKHVKTDQWLDDRQLINPDGTVCDWVMPVVEKPGADPTYLLPLIECRHTDSTDMRQDLSTVAVTLVPDGDGFKPKEGDDGRPVVRRLSAVPAYYKDIGRVQDDYHPNEVAADWFAELAVFDEMPPDGPRAKSRDKDAQKLKPIRAWATKAFAEPVPSPKQ
jgi:hypothetical protein